MSTANPWEELGITEEEWDAEQRNTSGGIYYRSNSDKDPYYRTQSQKDPYYRSRSEIDPYHRPFRNRGAGN